MSRRTQIVMTRQRVDSSVSCCFDLPARTPLQRGNHEEKVASIYRISFRQVCDEDRRAKADGMRLLSRRLGVLKSWRCGGLDFVVGCMVLERDVGRHGGEGRGSSAGLKAEEAHFLLRSTVVDLTRKGR